MKYKVVQKRAECIGCGACVASCSDNWEMAKDNKAKPKKTAIDDSEFACNKEAADACPVKCIEIKKA